MTAVALHPPQRLAIGGASRPRTAFILSGGASLGALQVGMLEALYERGITPDFRVGGSTVEYHLHEVFSELNIRSRTQLPLALPQEADALPAPAMTGGLASLPGVPARGIERWPLGCDRVAHSAGLSHRRKGMAEHGT
jgi:hypothetical protein